MLTLDNVEQPHHNVLPFSTFPYIRLLNIRSRPISSPIRLQPHPCKHTCTFFGTRALFFCPTLRSSPCFISSLRYYPDTLARTITRPSPIHLAGTHAWASFPTCTSVMQLTHLGSAPHPGVHAACHVLKSSDGNKTRCTFVLCDERSSSRSSLI